MQMQIIVVQYLVVTPLFSAFAYCIETLTCQGVTHTYRPYFQTLSLRDLSTERVWRFKTPKLEPPKSLGI